MAPSAFLFGKLPSHGDFVVRGLSAAEQDRWDRNSAAMMQTLEAASGAQFAALHVAAPPWRFLTQSEGARWSAGALAPSIDAVGRRFLLAVGVQGLAPEIASAGGLALAQAAEGLVYEALAASLSADALHAAASERLCALTAELEPPAIALRATLSGPGAWWTLGSPSFAPSAVVAGAPPADLFARTIALACSAEAAS